jgi:hypothetical protein
MDGVIVFYVINLLLVIADTILFYRNLWIEKHSGGRKPED